jgi:hypothetical protein
LGAAGGCWCRRRALPAAGRRLLRPPPAAPAVPREPARAVRLPAPRLSPPARPAPRLPLQKVEGAKRVHVEETRLRMDMAIGRIPSLDAEERLQHLREFALEVRLAGGLRVACPWRAVRGFVWPAWPALQRVAARPRPPGSRSSARPGLEPSPHCLPAPPSPLTRRPLTPHPSPAAPCPTTSAPPGPGGGAAPQPAQPHHAAQRLCVRAGALLHAAAAH